ncbi:MAG: hypothetical protein ABI640_05250 [Gammaproteobacteria bacterium]
MPSGSDNKIRSVKDNPAGKVVADAGGNRWQWDSNDETAIQLKKLNNDELAIEQTNIHPRPTPPARAAATAKPGPEAAKPSMKRRDVGGGVNPYDNPGKSRRR